ncbi:MAG TPA: twin-arginine translocation signal domain-containing protein, partial [Chryseosolibacter sp.]|nr:twin-arginine translocation signal domain-containing protein [Chryseosolibacter sp.]
MKRRNFLTKSTLATGVFASGLTTLQAQPQPAAKELYELRIYELRWGSDALDNYLSKALIPALNRLGVKRVGAFSQIGDPEPKKIYLLIPYASFEDYGRIVYALKTDKE